MASVVVDVAADLAARTAAVAPSGTADAGGIRFAVGVRITGAVRRGTPTITDTTAITTNNSSATILNTPPSCTMPTSPRASPHRVRSSSETCSRMTGRYMIGRYGNGRRKTAGRMVGAWAMIIEMTKPKKMACSTASYGGPEYAGPPVSQTPPATTSQT